MVRGPARIAQGPSPLGSPLGQAPPLPPLPSRLPVPDSPAGHHACLCGGGGAPFVLVSQPTDFPPGTFPVTRWSCPPPRLVVPARMCLSPFLLGVSCQSSPVNVFLITCFYWKPPVSCVASQFVSAARLGPRRPGVRREPRPPRGEVAAPRRAVFFSLRRNRCQAGNDSDTLVRPLVCVGLALPRQLVAFPFHAA